MVIAGFVGLARASLSVYIIKVTRVYWLLVSTQSYIFHLYVALSLKHSDE